MSRDALITAIKSGDDTQILEFFKKDNIGKYINNQSTERDGTALFHASCSGELWLVQKLLELGADTETSNTLLCTPLHGACDNEHADVVRLLIKYRASINAQNLGGDTACHLVSYRGNLEIVKLLVEHGADLNIVNNKGMTAISEAQALGHTKVIQYLSQKIPTERKNRLQRAISHSGVVYSKDPSAKYTVATCWVETQPITTRLFHDIKGYNYQNAHDRYRHNTLTSKGAPSPHHLQYTRTQYHEIAAKPGYQTQHHEMAVNSRFHTQHHEKAVNPGFQTQHHEMAVYPEFKTQHHASAVNPGYRKFGKPRLRTMHSCPHGHQTTH